MSRAALDSNILVYAELEPETDKGRRAAHLILRAARDGVIPTQVLGEFLRVVQHKAPNALAGAVRQIAIYRASFFAPATDAEVISAAAETARLHGVQVWDAVVCAAAAKAGATILLSEDMQDGRAFHGLRIVNPFIAANDVVIEQMLGA